MAAVSRFVNVDPGIQPRENAYPHLLFSKQPASDTPRHSSKSNTLPPAIPQIYNRISQWMLSGWWGSCEPKPGTASRQYQSDPTACKGCREWQVPCDHTKPQCQHCYEQQILCFYVDPNPKRKTYRPPLTDVPRIRVPTPRRRL
jgi:hypothetical protein